VAPQDPVAPQSVPTDLQNAIKENKVLRYPAWKWLHAGRKSSYKDVNSFGWAEIFVTAALSIPIDVRERFNGSYGGFVSSFSSSEVHFYISESSSLTNHI